MSEVLSVSQLVEAVNNTLQSLAGLTVEGEVEQFKIIHNKWVIFSLKDEESSVGCFMPIWDFKAQVEDGMLVRVKGRPALRNKGFFSFVLSDVQPAGEGALKRAFELLKQKLATEGLFAPERKRLLPRHPQRIALVTSQEAAAYNDFLKVLAARFGGLDIYFLHTQVQGEDAPRQIIAALEYANTNLKDLDVLVLVRGGGSLEDLHAFNDESVVRAVAASRTPTVVGIGHERDVCLAELAADVRASTPSNAAELAVRSREEVASAIINMTEYMRGKVLMDLREKSQSVDRQVAVLKNLTAGFRQQTEAWVERLQEIFGVAVGDKQQALLQTTRLLASLSPANILRRGFSITKNEAGDIVKSALQLPAGAVITSQLARGEIESTVN
ncbi:MAG: exodeoxyribonuclease VII large subunit [Candidatus Andersenbacteria bacterium]|nr:exodeoxyribonuclease VII large subunit [bacterium]MDZ4225316.1 exodeoxyribonuclease VII large subunit [Candidatus Andersenbacteria bacterium]